MKHISFIMALLTGINFAAGDGAAGEIVTDDNIQVCRKPMMAKLHIALKSGLHVPKNNEESRKVFRTMQEIMRDLQEEQQKYCFTAQRIEITGGGEEKFELSWGHWCREYTALANGEEVYVAYGSQKKQYGHCP